MKNREIETGIGLGLVIKTENLTCLMSVRFFATA
jgi:hypothetical protein